MEYGLEERRRKTKDESAEEKAPKSRWKIDLQDASPYHGQVLCGGKPERGTPLYVRVSSLRVGVQQVVEDVVRGRGELLVDLGLLEVAVNGLHHDLSVGRVA